jgi:hypothetical protein
MTEFSRVSTFTYHGTWEIRVVRKISDWPQRIVVTGAVNLVFNAVPGVYKKVSGDTWALSIEHNEGGVWRPNKLFVRGPRVDGRIARQTVFSKDRTWPGDITPDDLVVELKPSGTGWTVFRSRAVDKDLSPCKDGLRGAEPRYLAVDLGNTGHRSFDYDTVVNITQAGRNALADHGVRVLDTWSEQDLRRVGQEVHGGGAVSVPPIRTGERATAHFLIDASASRAGRPEVEFELLDGEDMSAGRLASATVEIGDAVPATAAGSQRQGPGAGAGRLTAPAERVWAAPAVVAPPAQARVRRPS